MEKTVRVVRVGIGQFTQDQIHRHEAAGKQDGVCVAEMGRLDGPMDHLLAYARINVLFGDPGLPQCCHRGRQ